MTRSLNTHRIRASHTLHYGPGGNECPCCNKYRCHPRRMKALTHRLERRVTKNQGWIDWADYCFEEYHDWIDFEEDIDTLEGRIYQDYLDYVNDINMYDHDWIDFEEPDWTYDDLV